MDSKTSLRDCRYYLHWINNHYNLFQCILKVCVSDTHVRINSILYSQLKKKRRFNTFHAKFHAVYVVQVEVSTCTINNLLGTSVPLLAYPAGHPCNNGNTSSTNSTSTDSSSTCYPPCVASGCDSWPLSVLLPSLSIVAKILSWFFPLVILHHYLEILILL